MKVLHQTNNDLEFKFAKEFEAHKRHKWPIWLTKPKLLYYEIDFEMFKNSVQKMDHQITKAVTKFDKDLKN